MLLRCEYLEQVNKGKKETFKSVLMTHPSVNDLLEMDCHCATHNVGMLITVVNQNADFLTSDFVGAVTEHKQHGINYVGFSTAIRSNNG